MCTFLELYRESKFTQPGEIIGECKEPLAGVTIRQATLSLAKTFSNSFGWSPFHDKGDYNRRLTEDYNNLLKAYENVTPNMKLQKAITQDLLRCLAQSSPFSVTNDTKDHAIDLAIGLYFFAMRSCEYSKTPTPGKTKMITLGGIKFFTTNRIEINHQDPQLIEKSTYVWILFEDQRIEKYSKRECRRK